MALQVQNTQLGLYDSAACPERGRGVASRRASHTPAMAHAAVTRTPITSARVARTGAERTGVNGTSVKLCAGCRAKEARYGFREDEGEERPRTLCFQCFRMELDWRQRVAAQLARGWNAEQERLPLAATLKALTARRRRAQILARHALGAE